MSWWIALGCTIAVLLFLVAVATGTGGGDDSSAGGPEHDHRVQFREGWVSTHKRVLRHEALPCTGAKDPINFEIFSAGPSVAGVPLTDFNRRCGGTTPAEEPPANLTNYFYGHCKIPKGDSGCSPPLEIQTWPACQRSLGNYTYEGKPMPYRRLPSIGGAEVVEILFEFEPRIEVYTGSSTIVLFAENPDLANKALAQLESQQIGKPPATRTEELEGKPDEHLAAPSAGATEGELQCQS